MAVMEGYYMNQSRTQPVEDWLRIFAHRFVELAKGEADVLQIADWAIELHQTEGHPDPATVAEEEFAKANPPKA
ncbi:MAG: hypothetical protein ACREX4_22780 [Gammaproteobacteria bacterium]